MKLHAVITRAAEELRGRRVPRCPPEWVVGPPDFIGIGAQRSGTSWWYELLVAHPGVQPTSRKELHYFHQFWNRPFTDLDAERYGLLFPRPRDRVTGEWSPGYMAHFWIPPLVVSAAPRARLLVILRNPVERYRSGLLLRSQTRSRSAAMASASFRLGSYASQFERLFRFVPREQTLVLQYERCVADPNRELARTYRFLGLDDAFVPDDLLRRRNELRGVKPELTREQRAVLVQAYEPEMARLRALDVGIDFGLWHDFAHLER